MDWKALTVVLGKVGMFFLCIAFGATAAILAVYYLGQWSLMIVPLCLLYFVIKMMYLDEVSRRGKSRY